MSVTVFWTAVAAMTILAVWIIAKDRSERGKPIDWDAPARDLDEIEDPPVRLAPVRWSDALPPGGWVCAALIDDMPGGICGWPAESEPCPQHGPLLLPGGGA